MIDCANKVDGCSFQNPGNERDILVSMATIVDLTIIFEFLDGPLKYLLLIYWLCTSNPVMVIILLFDFVMLTVETFWDSEYSEEDLLDL